ncbi:MFS monocarboxylate transporter [Mollisia scopiformis]|uniref:MFS monocarboxylate transporter n=1 Tax=Mollisia scopiformis TaxID=149040 RepID=A0A194XJ97_MOLSC|nr:MFS monocarboxylate transporter [Mollisia scopiformis]KUJ19832.1 MFS monocarboxylate transporter [Mollisia scopiformis]
MESQNDIVLNDVSNFLGNNQDGDDQTLGEDLTGLNEFSLPQADGGKDAWLFLAAGFMAEFMVWGLPFSFGVFQEYYTTHEPFSSQSSGIAVIGTTATGVMYMIGLIIFPAYKQWPHLASISKWAGIPLMAAGLIGASFAQSVNHLIVTQGVLYALGGCIIYYPILMYIDEWFVQRKGLAYGIMWAGTGFGGLTIPFILNALLSKYGFRTTLRIWALALLVLALPLVHFLRPRLPISPSSQSPRYGLSFLKSSSFWLLQLGLVIESLGYFIPSIYLPLFARSLGLSPSIGTLLIALLNAAGVVATILFGMLVDRFHVTTVILLSSLGTTISVFLLWGLSTALPLLVVFSIVYGFFAGGFVSTNAGVIKLVKQGDGSADVGILLGIISAARGVGAIASGPLSDAVLRGRPWAGEAGGAYGSGYGGLIVFTGVSAAVGGVGFLGRRLGWV